jgi:hypothetical protein
MAGTWIHDMSTTFSYPPEKNRRFENQTHTHTHWSKLTPKSAPCRAFTRGYAGKNVCCHPYSHILTICFTNAHTNLRVGLRVSTLLIHIVDTFFGRQ